MPTELELIALKTEFDLYLGFVKRLVLDLPSSEDRTRAALWLQKLRGIKTDEHMKLRNEHLKLFLFALHRRSLVGVFEKRPPKEELESFHDGLTLLEMTRELIEITERQKTAAKLEGEEGYGVCPLPPVRTNFSYDLKEYAACQQIPKFGYHVYYAVSNEPIQLWSKAPNQTYPEKHAIPNQFAWELSMSKICDGVLARQAEMDAKLDAEKQAEIGFIFDDKEEEEEKEAELDIKPCSPKKAGGDAGGFKWKSDSKLLIYQSYDFSDVGVAEDLIGQGKHQLEMDEHALNVLDESLPGRQRVHIRVPYYQGLPPDFMERRHHGVYDDIPEEEECDGPPCEEEVDLCDEGDAFDQDVEDEPCPCSCSDTAPPPAVCPPPVCPSPPPSSPQQQSSFCGSNAAPPNQANNSAGQNQSCCGFSQNTTVMRASFGQMPMAAPNSYNQHPSFLQQQMGQPMGQSMQQPMRQSMGQPMAQSMQQPMRQSMGQPMAQSMQQPMRQSMGQPMQQGMDNWGSVNQLPCCTQQANGGQQNQWAYQQQYQQWPSSQMGAPLQPNLGNAPTNYDASRTWLPSRQSNNFGNVNNNPC